MNRTSAVHGDSFRASSAGFGRGIDTASAYSPRAGKLMRGDDKTLSPIKGAVTLAALAIVVLTGFGVVRAGIGSLASSAFDLKPVNGGILLGLVCSAPPRLGGSLAGVVPWCAVAGVLGSCALWALGLVVLPRRLGSPWLAKMRLIATAVALSSLAPWVAGSLVAPGLGHPLASHSGVAAWSMGIFAAALGAATVSLLALRRIDVVEDIERPLPTILGSRFLHATLCAAILLFFAGAAVLNRVPPQPPAAAQQLGAMGAAAEEARLDIDRPVSSPAQEVDEGEPPPL